MATKRFSGILAGLALMALGAGCMTNKYTIGNGAATTAGNKVDKRWDLHFIYGLVGKGRIAVNCPSGNATVITQVTALNSLVYALTLGGLVAPSTTTVWCDPVAKVGATHLSPDEILALLNSPEFLQAVEGLSPEQAQALREALLNGQFQTQVAASESNSR